MNKIKQLIRLMALMVIISMASVGLGMGGAILPGFRGKFQDPETQIELVEEKEDDESEEIISEKN